MDCYGWVEILYVSPWKSIGNGMTGKAKAGVHVARAES